MMAVAVSTESPFHGPKHPRTSRDATIEALRFVVRCDPPLPIRRGILLADAVHHRFARALARAGGGTDETVVLGRQGAATDHQHAHWVPLAGPDGAISDLLIWVPARLTTAEVAAVLADTTWPVAVGTGSSGTDPQEAGGAVGGPPEVRLLLHSAGPADMVTPLLCGPATVWQTATPYLPVRHRKARHSVETFLAEDISHACAYRGLPAPTAVTRVHPGAGLLDGWAAGFRRYRIQEQSDRQRVGLGLRLVFARPVTGPVLLGRLAHFGFGVFLPTG